MNNINDSEALDSFQQTVARIVRRLLDESENGMQEQKAEREEKSCRSNAS
jgi:hypothetical protein